MFTLIIMGDSGSIPGVILGAFIIIGLLLIVGGLLSRKLKL
jgi:hypothetical protein